MQQIRNNCRQRFLELYSADTNYDMLMEIYQQAIASHRG